MDDGFGPVGWHIYFLGETYADVIEEKPFVHEIIDLGYTILHNSGVFESIEGTFLDSTKAIEIDYETLQNALEEANYADLLRNDPITTIRCLGLAAFKVNNSYSLI